jgi:hypothetical protein
MFSGNIRGNMELNELKLSEIQQDISTRRLANQMSNKNSLLKSLLSRIKGSRSVLNDPSEPTPTVKQSSTKVHSS